MAYLPLLPTTRDRVNLYLRGMAARGFGVVESMLREVCKTRPADFGPTDCPMCLGPSPDGGTCSAECDGRVM